MKKIITLSVLTLGALSLSAQEAHFQASLTPGLAIESRDTFISGVSLNIWGENPQSGLTLGFVNGSTGESSGFTLGLVNYDDSYNGVQWGLVNFSRESFVGWQKGIVNCSQGTFDGFQSGVVNYTEDFHGFQLGLLNYSQNLRGGLQIGLLNVAENNGWFDEFPDKLATAFPIVNWSF
jgi:hypothetical protein